MIDGVIKYSINHTISDDVKFKKYKKLEALRSRLFALGLIGELNGVGYGNISLRDSGKDSFYITATQTGELPSLKREHYTFIKDYDFSNFSVNSNGKYKPSSEALSHAMIYTIHPKINAVIHIHSKALWEFMKKNNSLFTTAEYGTTQMVEEISLLYHDKNPFDNSIFVMRGHEDGIVAFGNSIEKAQHILFTMIKKYIQK